VTHITGLDTVEIPDIVHCTIVRVRFVQYNVTRSHTCSVHYRKLEAKGHYAVKGRVTWLIRRLNYCYSSY